MIHEPPIGAHLVSPRHIVSPNLFSYTHHGIYVGDGRVVHYSGWSKPMTPGVIEEVTWEEFAAGNDVSIWEHPEADARATGRTASYVGAGTAVAGSVAAIGAAGVSGFSAVGITSGLASIGGLLGGGMATGIAMTVAAPVVAATAIGYGTYKLAQHLKQDGKDKLPATEGLASDVIQVDEQPRVWHIRRGDKEVGPVTGREFLAAAEQGVLEPTDLIWREGLPNWIALADLPKIAGSSEQI